MLLFASHTEAGTHDSAFIVAAFPYAYATQRGICQTALIFGKLKVRLWRPGFVVGAETQILI
jgi:hypothetical protein